MKNIAKKIKDFIVAIPSALKKIKIRKFNWTTVLAVLSYLNILVIISFVASKDKPFVRFHAKQGLVLLAFFALAVFSFYIPGIFYLFILFYAMCIIWGIVHVIRGGEKHLPIIGKLADRI